MIVMPITPEMAVRETTRRAKEWLRLKLEAEKARNVLRMFEEMYTKDGKIIVPQFVAWTAEEILAREG